MLAEVHQQHYDQVSPGLAPETCLHQILYQGASLPVEDVQFPQYHLPGQLLAENPENVRSGPQHRRYMIVGLSPDNADSDCGRHLTSHAGGILRSALEQAQISLDDIYYTTVNRWPKTRQITSLKAKWLQIGWHYILEEIKLVQPDAILFLGAEPTKLAFSQKLDTLRGQPQVLNVGDRDYMCLCANSHLSFVSNTAGLGTLITQLKIFKDMGYGKVNVLDGISYPDRDYKVINSADELEFEIHQEIQAGHTRFAIDVETGTDTGHPEDDYIVSFQWSHGPGHSRVIPLLVEREEQTVLKTKFDKKLGQEVPLKEAHYLNDLDPLVVKAYEDKAPTIIGLDSDVEIKRSNRTIDGVKKFRYYHNVDVYAPEYGGSGVEPKCQEDRVADWGRIRDLVIKLLTWSPDTCLMGHNVRYDLQLLRDDFGLEIRQFCNANRCWDTMLAVHLLGKESSNGLKEQTLKHTMLGAYDAPMLNWVEQNSGTGKLFPGEDEDRFFAGYRDICYKYLLPYAMVDVDATYQLYYVFDKQLNEPGNEKLRKLYYEVELPLIHPLIDIETTGMPASYEALDDLSDIYLEKHQSLAEEIRELINWPTFNPGSTSQLQHVLYAPPFKGYRQSKDESKLPPKDAKLLNLVPVLTTGKYPTKWETIVSKGQQPYNSPSASFDTVEMLIIRYKEHLPEDKMHILLKIKDFLTLKQFVSLYLCKPKWDTPIATDRPIYGKGLMSCIRKNGRVCTQISTLSETGRHKHKRPNLANLPKNKEALVSKIMGFDVPMVRTCFECAPGRTIMENDYSSAEIFVLAYLSQDPSLIEVVESGVDVHGYNAVKVFNLDCEPDEVKDKYKSKRAAVKAIIFGLVYGLSAAGLADQLTNDTGQIVTKQDAEVLMQTFFDAYPKVKEFLEQSKRDCLEKGYVETAYGRRRYFPGVTRLSKEKQAAAQREATNARIQGTVADMLNVSLINLDRMRYEHPVGNTIQWQTCVPIHDAIITEQPEEHTPLMTDIMFYCMSVCTPIPGTGGKTLKVDADIGTKWQQFLSYDKWAPAHNITYAKKYN